MANTLWAIVEADSVWYDDVMYMGMGAKNYYSLRSLAIRLQDPVGLFIHRYQAQGDHHVVSVV